MSARESGSASGSTPLLPDEYDSLIERVRETANAMIPRNATVLVVSRGDDELLRLGPRRALHFPQDEFGRYAGYHPADSDAAVAALEDMRARGAEYLLLPSTSFWWLDYYDGFRDHLERSYPSIVSADDCMVFELAATGVQAAAADADTDRVAVATSTRQLAGPLDELLRALLPEDARIAVVGAGEAELPSFGQCHSLPAPDQGGLEAVLDAADRARAEFVVVPVTSYHRVHGDASTDVPARWRLVTRQRHLAEIYEREPGGDVPPAAAGAGASHDGASTGAPPARDRGLWQRVRDLFRRR